MEERFDGFDGIDSAAVRAEKAKARKLRRSRWWQRKIAAGRCFYCGRTVGAAALTMDHVVPLSRGGKSRKNNLVPCCKSCNTGKKTALPMEWEGFAGSDGM